MTQLLVRQGAQGDLLLRVVDKLPDGAKEIPAESGRHVVGHSETGHHHVVRADRVAMYGIDNPLVCYLRIDAEHADLVHERSFDTHAPWRLPGGGKIVEVRRQREHTPEGWREVAD